MPKAKRTLDVADNDEQLAKQTRKNNRHNHDTMDSHDDIHITKSHKKTRLLGTQLLSKPSGTNTIAAQMDIDDLQHAIAEQGQPFIDRTQNLITEMTGKSKDLETITRSTISECVPSEDSSIPPRGIRPDSVLDGNPVFRHAQHVLDSSQQLLEIYRNLDNRIAMLRQIEPNTDVLLKDVAQLEKLLETQARKTKREISNHLHHSTRGRKRGTHSENEDVKEPFVREARKSKRKCTRDVKDDNWACEANRLERNVGRLVKYLSDNEEA